MQIQLNTDNHVHGEASLATWVEAELKDRLARFRDHVTRIEVHLSDVNAARTDGQDKRCKLEARLAGRQPVAVQHDAAKVAEAVHGAADKLARMLDTTLGRAKDAKGRESIRGT
ncbi:HPF/RaiA family ribosome-associated protein [Azohydromonas sediminis]|uniref:HPF/RaiA family ribosome-associated protein n=1 Tax=Azohydromonas sediminis TaxID=2259674 RepID=UPI000E6593D2|nr:HPF/RaiA family ribosome-associated protein [Azohydromonas sediminis]